MSAFLSRLRQSNSEHSGRRWVYVPYDQLSDRIGVLSREKPRDAAILLIESHEHVRRRPYHRQRLALLWSNQRHFALEQARRGVFVEYVISRDPISSVVERVSAKAGSFEVLEPAERELREELRRLVNAGVLRTIPHDGWLTGTDELKAAGDGPPWRMDAFYRHVRRRTGILMENGRPVGGKYSFDPENRRPWKGQPPAPEPPSFPVEEIKKEVAGLVLKEFSEHPGGVDLVGLPATSQDVARLWSWAKNECIPYFGPYEDAMSRRSPGLFHTRLSSLMNIHRILPRTVVDDVTALSIPLASKEAYVRQVLGWREFVYQVHRATDGFRLLPGGPPPVLPAPGDGGYRQWSGRPWPHGGSSFEGACPSALEARNPLPKAWWGVRSGLDCLDTVVSDVWRDGWSHHITRLMVLSNIAALLEVSPRQLTDWFWIAYTDAYDWVVEPNVLGMGTFALGDLMTTKPYICGANYIKKMSDYCGQCSFDPSRNCPISKLYWAYLARHEDALGRNPRLRTIYAGFRRRSAQQQRQDKESYEYVISALMTGGRLNVYRVLELLDS